MGVGYLIIQTFIGEYLFPVTGANIIIKCDEGNILHELYTNEKGLTEAVELPASEENTASPLHHKESFEFYCRRYTVEISHKGGFRNTIVHGVEVFPAITSILPVQMQPATSGVTDDNEIFIPNLRGADLEDRFVPEAFALSSSEYKRFNAGVTIPDYIVVNISSPGGSDENLKVSFKDYIKNTASSENYPTWEDAALKANILMQISLALSRISTKHYRGHGNDFDITNNFSRDQAFVKGRNIFGNISKIVDELFNCYIISTEGNIPAGISNSLRQGARRLSLRGYNPLQIIKYYHPDYDIKEFTGFSLPYPGSVLREGAEGNHIAAMQTYLKRIGENWHIPPIGEADGIYGPCTKAAVFAFQEIFNLASAGNKGAIDKSTWYEIIRIYNIIKNSDETEARASQINMPNHSAEALVTEAEGFSKPNATNHLSFAAVLAMSMLRRRF